MKNKMNQLKPRLPCIAKAYSLPGNKKSNVKRTLYRVRSYLVSLSSVVPW